MYNNAEIVQIDDQDTTDFEKCIDYLRSKLFSPLMVPNVIMCIGGFGGRVDHMMSQVHELYKATRKCAEDGNLVYYVTTESISWVLERGVHEIKVRDPAHPGVLGTKVGIAPFKGPAVVTTKGLQWDVEEWVTEVGVKMSTSNEVKDDTIYIETTHPIMFTIDLGPNAAPCESPPPAMSRNITDAHLTPFTDCVNFDSPQPVGGDIPMDG
jgi:thiamine pyrophosphokinase